MVQWVRRDAPEPLLDRQPPVPSVPEAIDRVMPGLAALFERIQPDRSHAILDLGTGDGSNVAIYSRYARWIRFADVLNEALTPEWESAIDAISANPDRPYDIVFIWDLFDRLKPEDRGGLVAKLARLTAPDAHLHAIVESPDDQTTALMRFSLAGPDRMRIARDGPPRPVHPATKPADVKAILEPFHLLKAFSTRAGIREYVAVRRWEGSNGF